MSARYAHWECVENSGPRDAYIIDQPVKFAIGPVACVANEVFDSRFIANCAMLPVKGFRFLLTLNEIGVRSTAR